MEKTSVTTVPLFVGGYKRAVYVAQTLAADIYNRTDHLIDVRFDGLVYYLVAGKDHDLRAVLLYLSAGIENGVAYSAFHAALGLCYSGSERRDMLFVHCAELVAVALVRTFHFVLEQRDVELRFVQQIRAERRVK